MYKRLPMFPRPHHVIDSLEQFKGTVRARTIFGLLIILMPMLVVGCDSGSVQKTGSSHLPAANTSNSTISAAPANPVNKTAAQTQSSPSQTPTSVPPPDPTTVFQNINQSPAPGSTGSTIQKVVSSGKQGLQQAAQQVPLKPTENQIVAPYISQLEGLQSTYIEQLYAMYNSAKAEYHSGKETKLQVIHKYVPKALSLESHAQDQVNSALFSLRNKLVAEGYPTDEVNVLRNAYYTEVATMQAKFGR